MARFWGRRRPAVARETTEERVEAAPPPRPRPFWPWLLLLLAVVLAALAASWYFANRGETVEAKKVPDVVGLQRTVAEQRVQERGFEVETKLVVSPRQPGTVVAQRPEPGTLYGKGGIVVLSVARNPLKVEVPDVTGLATANALAKLRGAGLQPRAQTVAARQPKGRVVRQVPEAGTEVPKGSAVVVLVSAGPKLAKVPDVVGLATEEATTQLTAAGFRTRIDRVAGSQPEGTVVTQRPPGGTRAQRGRVVQISVSIGETQTTTTVVTTTTNQTQGTVPDTVGMDEQSATFSLEDAGYRVRVRNRPVTDPSQDGVVVQQIPAGGTRRSGSTVTIIVGIIR
jgi:eukaryotic-like serine/threonine-protein kinase